jgi:hypothetical protein
METANFILYNLPRWAQQCETNKTVSVGYDNMRETLSQFGKVKVLSIEKGTLCARFNNKKDAKCAHELINRMMIGDNIVRTQYVY